MVLHLPNFLKYGRILKHPVPSLCTCTHAVITISHDYYHTVCYKHFYDCRIYKDCILEVSVLAVLGQEVWLQRGEARDFKVMMELGYNISHGRNLLRYFYYIPIDMFITCECNTVLSRLKWNISKIEKAQKRYCYVLTLCAYAIIPANN